MRLLAALHLVAIGESRGGVSPPRAPKTVLEPLDSHGFRCSAADIEEPPIGEERWIGSANPGQPLSCSLGPSAQALELPTRPADQIGVDTQQRRSQLRSIEVAEVVDPARDVRIVRLSQIFQGLVAVMVKGPAPDGPADGLQRFRASRGHEAVRRDTALPKCSPCSESEPEKVERLVLEVAAPVRIFAVDDLRLLRMQDQLAGREAISKYTP